jgi:hypothetical protein
MPLNRFVGIAVSWGNIPTSPAAQLKSLPRRPGSVLRMYLISGL